MYLEVRRNNRGAVAAQSTILSDFLYTKPSKHLTLPKEIQGGQKRLEETHACVKGTTLLGEISMKTLGR